MPSVHAPSKGLAVC